MAQQLLVLIDPQNDFTHAESDYARRHKGVSWIAEAKSCINRLLQHFGKDQWVILRSDYRPGQFEAGLSIGIPGSFGHQIDADLPLDDSWTILAKTEHSCFSSEAFKDLLQARKADTLLLCGFLAEYCVKKTAADALRLGLRVILVEDCIGTGDDVQHRKDQVLAELMEMGATVVRSGELIA